MQDSRQFIRISKVAELLDVRIPVTALANLLQVNRSGTKRGNASD
jgi:hypothetical protein